jgi:hypothetical protein
LYRDSHVDWKQSLDKAKHCQEKDRHRQEMDRKHRELDRKRQKLDRQRQELDRRLAKLLSDEAARRNSLLQREKSQEGDNMAALREAGNVDARAASEACHRNVIDENLPTPF